MPTRKSSRETAALNLVRLARLLHKSSVGQWTVFQPSTEFRTKCHNPDDVEPLDEVRWDPTSKRYRLVKDSKFNCDDAILQAMVMLYVVARVQHGWSHNETCAQISVWPDDTNTKLTTQSTLPNEWVEEKRLKEASGELGKRTMHCHQNYRCLTSLYSEDDAGWRNEGRNDKWNSWYSFTEHSVVQWALHQRGSEMHLSELSVLLLKVMLNNQGSLTSGKERVAMAKVLADTLLREGVKDVPDTFCKRALIAIEQLDWDDELSKFDSRNFVAAGYPAKLVRAFRLQREFIDMVMVEEE